MTILIALALLLQQPEQDKQEQDEPLKTPEVVVIGRAENLVGTAESAAQGTVGAAELRRRPTLRPAEVLEAVPGVIVTQHSGSGKANQYFLRGFNLDHGTDFATFVDDVPVNFPTHGHGQGYTDLNFLIPELVEAVDYKKGPYYAEEGDFASAGAARIRLVDSLEQGLGRAEGGSFGFGRSVVAHSANAAGGRVLYAAEVLRYDGPWENDESALKLNALLRYSRGDRENGFSITGMFYRNEWDSTDQIPRRAVNAGLIDRFDAIDDSDGGDSHRYSLTAEWRAGTQTSQTRANAYFIDYALSLFSNFTYFVDPAGDQFEQADERRVFGASASHTWFLRLLGRDGQLTVGVQTRNDYIPTLTLRRTADRALVATTREDRVLQSSAGAYVRHQMEWTPWLRTVAGLRGDVYRFDIDSNIDENSGRDTDGIASPKLTVVLGPGSETEFYANAGLGFHSNDGRGTTIRIDPATGDPAQRVDPLVRSRGADVGVRTSVVPGLRSSLTAFILELESELLFVGDAGSTEAGRPSRRTGIEFANFYQPASWLTIDVDVCLSRARFRDSAPEGDRIPGAIERSIAAGVAVDDLDGFFASARVRHFGERPLVEDDSVRSDASTLLTARAGYRHKGATLAVECFNLLNAKDDDITYYYESQLPGEGAPVADEHFHPVEPRAFRVSVDIRF